ncbi:hypothetical protein GR160_03000 [Flavobacterium sp. Sd200]|nr:hypothetical protein [Flavobacterium sp. Sd200]MXN90182.1 hypothetical protein [Flavobacterium sp. Sd200]
METHKVYDLDGRPVLDPEAIAKQERNAQEIEVNDAETLNPTTNANI